MDKGREKYIQHIEQMLPPEMKGKGEQVIDRMEMAITEMLGIVERVCAEPELPGKFKTVTVHKMFAVLGHQILANEGIAGLTEAGKETVQYCLLEHAQAALKKNEEPLIKIVPDLPGALKK